MTKLEQAVKKMDSDFKSRFPEKTIAEKTMESVMNRLNALSMDENEESKRHASAKLELARRSRNLHATCLILKGLEGFMRISQHQTPFPRSGFDSFEDFAYLAEEMFVSVSLIPLEPFHGSYVFKISENGMMTIVASKVDSSDSTKVGSNN